MAKRMDYPKASPAVIKAMSALEKTARELVADETLFELVKMRASQINGCAYCVDMHTIDARAAGETEQRIYLLPMWREAEELYTSRERAALAWTESLTLVASTGVPDADFKLVRSEFSEAEIANLTLLIIAINGWNRLGVGFRLEPGHHRARVAAD